MNVLLVDDEPLIREIIYDFLTDSISCKIAQVNDGMQALQILQKDSFDLIITDHRMPSMTGLTMVSHLRNSPGPNQQTTCILVTGFIDEAEDVLKYSDCYLLGKPFTEEQLINLVKIVKPTFFIS